MEVVTRPRVHASTDGTVTAGDALRGKVPSKRAFVAMQVKAEEEEELTPITDEYREPLML